MGKVSDICVEPISAFASKLRSYGCSRSPEKPAPHQPNDNSSYSIPPALLDFAPSFCSSFRKSDAVVVSSLVHLVHGPGLSACDDAQRFTRAEPGEARSGGSATVRKTDQNSFSLPSANLPPSRRVDFSVGNSFFRSPWVIAPSTTTARDGLGPLFNTNACQGCHIKDGRGHPPAPDSPNAVSMLVRLSIPDAPAYAKVIEQFGVVPEPVYGGQLQDMSVPGVAPEGKVRVDYTPVSVRFKDGTEIELRKPSLNITQLAMARCTPTPDSLHVSPHR